MANTISKIKLKTLESSTEGSKVILYPQTNLDQLLKLKDTATAGSNVESDYELAGAEHILNKVESVKDGSTELVKADKTVTLPVYDVVKEATAEAGFTTTYKVTKTVDGVTTQVGASINLKDLLVKSGKVSTVTDYAVNTAYNKSDVINNAGSTYVVTADISAADNTEFSKVSTKLNGSVITTGTKAIVLVVNAKDAETTGNEDFLVISVKELVDVYNAGNGLTLSADNKFSVNLTANKGLGFDSTSAEGSKTLEVLVDTDKAINFGTDGKLGVQVDDSTVGYNSSTKALEVKDNGITTAKIVDANVTTAKIADSNVTTDKLANNAVTTVKIADANVTTAKIAPHTADGYVLKTVEDTTVPGTYKVEWSATEEIGVDDATIIKDTDGKLKVPTGDTTKGINVSNFKTGEVQSTVRLSTAATDNNLATELATRTEANKKVDAIKYYDNTATTSALDGSEVRTATLQAFVGANTTDGKAGVVPTPLVANKGQFLRGDGTWADPIANVTYEVVS